MNKKRFTILSTMSLWKRKESDINQFFLQINLFCPIYLTIWAESLFKKSPTAEDRNKPDLSFFLIHTKFTKVYHLSKKTFKRYKLMSIKHPPIFKNNRTTSKNIRFRKKYNWRYLLKEIQNQCLLILNLCKRF